MKKVLALLLACLMLVSVLASCQTGGGGTGDGTGDAQSTDNNGSGSGEDEITSETEVETETDEYGRVVQYHDIPIESLNFGNVEFNVIGRNVDYTYVDLGNYEKPADALQLVLVERNMQIEEEMGIVFQFDLVECEGMESTLFKTVENDYKGDGKYEMIHSYSAYAVSPLIRDYLVNFLYTDQVPYMDTTRSWWNQNFIENTQAAGQLYYIIGDSNLCAYNRMMATYVNQDLYDEYVSEEDGWVGNLYELVLDGGWTIEMLHKYAAVYDDVNGDTVKDAGDVYGLISISGSEAQDGFLYAFDLNLTTTASDGTHSWNIENNTFMEQCMDKMVDLYNQNGAWVTGKTPGSATGSGQCWQMFSTGKAIFTVDIIYRTSAQNEAYRNMKDKYLLLPLPKYDEEQAEYGSGMQDSNAWVSVPKHSKYNAEMVSAVLEYLNFLGWQTVRPYYFEKIMKTQYLGTLESAKVFDLILATCDFDFGEQYSSILNHAKRILWRYVGRNEGTVTAAWTENSESLKTSLAELDYWFMSKTAQ